MPNINPNYGHNFQPQMPKNSKLTASGKMGQMRFTNLTGKPALASSAMLALPQLPTKAENLKPCSFSAKQNPTGMSISKMAKLCQSFFGNMK